MFEQLLSAGKLSNRLPLPGPKDLITGDSNLGFYGEFPASEFITFPDLSAAVGVTEGTLPQTNEKWLKIAYAGKILYIPKTPVRHNLSWADLNSHQVVSAMQDTQIPIRGYNFRVRLMQGSNTNPYPSASGDAAGGQYSTGTEWNKIMYGLMPSAVQPADMEGISLANYTTSELGFSPIGDGSCPWVMETAINDGAVLRTDGSGNIKYISQLAKTFKDTYRGWRPVLEYVDDKNQIDGVIFYFNPKTLTDTSNGGLGYTTGTTGSATDTLTTIFGDPTIRVGASNAILNIKFNTPWNMNTKEFTIEWSNYVNPAMSTQYVNEFTLSKNGNMISATYLRWEQTNGGNGGPLNLWVGASSTPLSQYTKAATSDNKLVNYALTLKDNKLSLYINGSRVMQNYALPIGGDFTSYDTIGLGWVHVNAIASPGNRSAIRICNKVLYTGQTYVVEPY